MNRINKRISKLLLSLIMVFVLALSTMPMDVFALETDGIKECHPTHDENCGYIALEEESPCAHTCERCEGKDSGSEAQTMLPNTESKIIPENDVTIDAVNFPDEEFRSYVGSSSANIDRNSDGILDANERKLPVYIGVNNKNIKSLTGLEYFSNLISLNCSDTEITELDVSNNPNLTNLRCSNTAITELNLTNNKELLVVDCDFTNIARLDISSNTKLTHLFCSSTEITELDISNHPDLLQLSAGIPKLTKLTTGTHSKLNSLNLDKTGVTEVDMNGMPALVSLRCEESAIARLDLKNNLELNYLTCYKSGITELDVSKNTKLETLNVNDTRLTTLDVSNNYALKTLLCPTTDITELDVSNNLALTQLSCGDSKIGWINIGNNTNLSNFSKDRISNRFDVPDDSFDITEKFPNIDVSKLKITSGATLDGNIVKDFTSTTINYTYDCGTSANGKETLSAQIYLTLLLTVTFDVNGGSGTNSTVKVYSGQKATAPAAKPIKEGFHFTGWYKENGVKFNADWAIYENSTYFARFDAHTPATEWSKDDTNHWHECTANDGEKMDLASHKFGDWVIDTIATETEKGSKHRDCTVCSERETMEIPVLSHTHTPASAWSKDDTNHWHECTANDGEKMDLASHKFGNWIIETPATETTKGSKHRDCTVCGQRETMDISATGVKPERPVITAGAGSIHQISNGKDMTLICSGKLEDLTGIYIDGKLLDENNYTLKSGSTILTIEASYLDTLSAGKHILKFQYKDNVSAETDFTIIAKAGETPAKAGSPKTGDTASTALYLGFIALSGFVAGFDLKKKKHLNR